VISGEASAGKTTLALFLADKIARGAELLASIVGNIPYCM